MQMLTGMASSGYPVSSQSGLCYGRAPVVSKTASRLGLVHFLCLASLKLHPDCHGVAHGLLPILGVTITKWVIA